VADRAGTGDILTHSLTRFDVSHYAVVVSDALDVIAGIRSPFCTGIGMVAGISITCSVAWTRTLASRV
jgi:hypothetical protein